MVTNPPGHSVSCWRDMVGQVWAENQFKGGILARPNPIYLRCKHGTLLSFKHDLNWNWEIGVVEEPKLSGINSA